MDIKIEVRNIVGLLKAIVTISHGIKIPSSGQWEVFPPTGFIYCFFVFNRAYSIDWAATFERNNVVSWGDSENRIPKEIDQIKSLIHFVHSVLGDCCSELLTKYHKEFLNLVNVRFFEGDLAKIDLTNSNKAIKNLAQKIKPLFIKIHLGQLDAKDFIETASHLARFIYLVRCNIFHGSKTSVQMANSSQKNRLAYYGSILYGLSKMIEDVVKAKDIGWTSIHFDP